MIYFTIILFVIVLAVAGTKRPTNAGKNTGSTKANGGTKKTK
jgi:hypothetical protein